MNPHFSDVFKQRETKTFGQYHTLSSYKEFVAVRCQTVFQKQQHNRSTATVEVKKVVYHICYHTAKSFLQELFNNIQTTSEENRLFNCRSFLSNRNMRQHFNETI